LCYKHVLVIVDDNLQLSLTIILLDNLELPLLVIYFHCFVL